MRFVLRGREPRWLAPAAVGVAVLLTLVLTALPIRLAGAAPLAAFERYVITPLTTPNGIAEVLLAATPLIFTGLAVAVAFRVGYYNIGAEGQFLAGAMATTAVALWMPDLPGAAALPVGLIAGALGGVAWAFLPAFLRRRFGIDEVVTTLLLNPVAVLLLQGLLTGPWRNPETGFPDSETFGPVRSPCSSSTATGLSSRVVTTSSMPNRRRRNAGRNAHAAPPTAPATRPAGSAATAGRSGIQRATAVVAIAPARNCPSAPML